MKDDNFYNFQAVSQMFHFSTVPYTKVKTLTYNQNEPMHMSYALDFVAPPTKVCITTRLRSPREALANPGKLPMPRHLTCNAEISEEKKKDLKSMLKFMPATDKAYYRDILK